MLAAVVACGAQSPREIPRDPDTIVTVKSTRWPGSTWHHTWFDVKLGSEDDRENAEARRFQNRVLFDPLVMHYGRQAVAVRLDRARHAELFASLKLGATPAVVVVKPDFTTVKAFEGRKLTARALGKTLRKVARDRKPPDRVGVHMHR